MTNNRPTDKQINYILAITNGRHESDAYRAIGQVCGFSMSSAMRRATKQDASKTIETLKSRA